MKRQKQTTTQVFGDVDGAGPVEPPEDDGLLAGGIGKKKLPALSMITGCWRPFV